MGRWGGKVLAAWEEKRNGQLSLKALRKASEFTALNERSYLAKALLGRQVRMPDL